MKNTLLDKGIILPSGEIKENMFARRIATIRKGGLK